MKNTPRRAVLYELISKSNPVTPGPPRPGFAPRITDEPDLPLDDAHEPPASAAPAIRVANGRLSLALTPATYIVAAGCLAAVMLTGYTLGRGAGSTPPTMTAVNDANQTPANPLLDQPQPPSAGKPDVRKSKDVHASDAKPRKSLDNQAASAAPDTRSKTAAPQGKQMRLWIQSIKARSAAEKRVAAQEAEHIRVFLAAQGVKARVMQVDNGVIVLSDEGYPSGSAVEADRAAFRKRMLQLGRIYRQQGGRYSFDGCFFAVD